MDKKKKERLILQMVYDIESFEEVIDFERPDFLIKHATEENYFGVEVTEFYFTESDARLHNISDYFKELIDEKEYRHKDDKDILKVDEIKIINQNDEVVAKTDSVIRELPNEKEYFDLVLERVLDKNGNIQNYKQQVNHVNLIVLDRENRLITFPSKDLVEKYFNSSIPSGIKNTGFKEIYFVTESKDEGRVFLRLKFLNFFREFYLFTDFIFKETKKDFIEDKKILTEFYYLLDSKGIEVRLINNEEGLEVVSGNYGVTILNGETKLRDYSDYTIDRLSNVKKAQSEFSKSFFQKFEEFRDNFSFTTNMVSKVFKDYDFYKNPHG